GKSEKAQQELAEARQIHPQSAILEFLTARRYLLEGKPDLAKNALAEALKLAPNFLPARTVMAELELKSGDARSAIRELDRLPRETWSLSANLLLSQAYAMQGEFAQAEDILNQFLSPDFSVSDQALVRQTLAWVRLRQGHYADAIQLATESLNTASPTVDCLRILGIAYVASNRPEQGLKAIQDFLAKADHWSAGQQLLGEFALKMGKLDVAEKAFETALELDRKTTAAIYGIGEVQRARGQYDAARASFERFASAEPTNAVVHLQLGGLAEIGKDWPQAILQYETAIKLDPDLAIAKNNLAWLYAEHGGSMTVALRLAQEARSSLPKDPHVADTLGWVMLKMGSAEGALPYLKECTAGVPKNAAYRYHLGMPYLTAGHRSDAKRELEKALRLEKVFDGSIEAERALQGITAAAARSSVS